ncbi:hypothetical protein [Halomarina rubra]|uniref:Uncharacterized protein n=1 Tax=Halomarina rubra TaxID=2071873 RepID=A0ABD6AWQ3_9EURY|nr:hypothetical protein [Halomarina rubra]
MSRDLTLLLAQPLLFSLLYSGASVLVTLFGLVVTSRAGAIVAAALLIGSYVLVTRVIPVPRPDRPVAITRHGSVDDVVLKNDAKLVLSAVVPGTTLLPFLFLPLSAYESIGVALVGLLLVGAYAAEAWAVYRLTAQYLPTYAPHLFGDDYDPPLE